MDVDTEKLLSKLTNLNGALDDLEATLEPLFSQTLPESVVGLENIQQAKLQVALPYLVYDLVFIYLKTKGIDPKTHPVIQELDRIREYFDKIKEAEDPAKRTQSVDKAAANRFIKHAIAQVKYGRPPGQDEGATTEATAVRVPVKVTSKMLARAQYQKELAEASSEEEGDLEIIEDAEPDAEEEEALSSPRRLDKGKGKAVDVNMDVDNASDSGRKRRRPQVDPFAGYGEEVTSATNGSKGGKRKKAGISGGSPAIIESGTSTPLAGSDTGNSSKKEKKSAKKAKKVK